MISENYVSVETAALLKKKGLDCEDVSCVNFYKGHIYVLVEKEPLVAVEDVRIPTLQMALKWLREIHNVVIVVDYIYECTDNSYCYKIYKLGENGKPERVPIEGVRYDTLGEPHVETVGYRDYRLSFFSYKTYEEACEAGIQDCLENLI